ncbi:splicing regulator SDE2 [Hippocampus zosterae]|uniref:splicing regulator SDE2 n=1 Tax=Hippocampus zosterae TaxID=109293 RepID=UPI00223D7B3C|nr:splicing regulator SDE2 [Hippocampus zosterae]
MEPTTEIFVCGPFGSRFSACVFPQGSSVRDVVERFVQQWAPVSSLDFYVSRDGGVTRPDEHLRAGAVYRLAPRLPGGKGGFGSMLRALGAQIEKTTNREACRDLSGRRLRDVNHEKEMGEWLKRQADREADKERRRAERLERKMAEPKHQFSDPAYQRQCHSLAERLEDSVLKGLQAASGSQAAAASKRPGPARRQPPLKKKKTTAGACSWTGLEDMSSEDEDDEDEPSRGETASSGEERGVAAPCSPAPLRAEAGEEAGEKVGEKAGEAASASV